MNLNNQNERIDGSVPGILRIVIPLILSAFSENLMFMVDRTMLAYYSINSMNAAIFGGTLAGMYTLILASIAGTAEIFVGQHNGASENDKIASPVWQMIYFVAFSLAIVMPLGYFADRINLIPEYCKEEGVGYQKILTYFCWLPALTSALTGFFVGRGKTKIITVVVVISTLANVALNRLLIFGCGEIIPSLGCNGAAIATTVSEAVQVAILAAGFWSKKNRKLYRTFSGKKFDWNLFRRCVRIGLPMSLGKCAEMLAWYLVYAALGHVSKELVTIHGMVVTIYVLFAFICDGLSKGSAAISANFIGQRDLSAIKVTVRRLTTITLVLCFTLMLPLLLSPNVIFWLLNTLREDISPLYPTMAIIFKILYFSITAEALCAVLWGVLLSGGDSKYPNIANVLCLWTFFVAPIGVLFFCGKLNSVIVVSSLSLLYALICLFVIHRRYRSLRWYKSLSTG
jgi:MATE family multidrug resistance protein